MGEEPDVAFLDKEHVRLEGEQLGAQEWWDDSQEAGFNEDYTNLTPSRLKALQLQEPPSYARSDPRADRIVLRLQAEDRWLADQQAPRRAKDRKNRQRAAEERKRQIVGGCLWLLQQSCANYLRWFDRNKKVLAGIRALDPAAIRRLVSLVISDIGALPGAPRNTNMLHKDPTDRQLQALRENRTPWR
jgi:hypothetical protein